MQKHRVEALLLLLLLTYPAAKVHRKEDVVLRRPILYYAQVSRCVSTSRRHFHVRYASVNHDNDDSGNMNKLSPRGRRNDMSRPTAVRLAADLRPSADGSAVRTLLVAGQPQDSQRADNLGSCDMQPACYSLCWDRQTDGSRYRWMPPLRRGGITRK